MVPQLSQHGKSSAQQSYSQTVFGGREAWTLNISQFRLYRMVVAPVRIIKRGAKGWKICMEFTSDPPQGEAVLSAHEPPLNRGDLG